VKLEKFLLFIFVFAALGIGLSIFYQDNIFTSGANAAIFTITNTCTGTYQVAGFPPVLSGLDTAAGTLLSRGPVAWISSVLLKATGSETQAVFTFSSDTEVDKYCLVKTYPDGNTETIEITARSYVDTNIIGDAVYYYAVSGFKTDAETGTVSNSIPIGIVSDGIIFSASTPNSTTIEIVARNDTRALVRINRPDDVFGDEKGIIKFVIRRITLDELLIPSWAKSGVASAYEVYCRVLSTGKSITYLAAPVEIILSYNVRRNVVTGTDVRANEVLLRLSNFRWDGTGWIRLPGAIDVSNQTIQSYINHLSYFGVCDIRLQQEPGFPYYGAEPNPFTPNNDGYNDVTYFKFPLAEEQGELTIFDINAAIVYKKTILPGQSWITWDGHYNQEGAGRTDLARAGIYIWQIKIGARIENGVVILAK